jgi:hypothetical protein
MSITLADFSFIRRSPAEISVLRVLFWLAKFKGDERSEDYLAHRCHMTTEEFRTVMDELAESGLIHHSVQGQGKSTFHDFHLRRDKIEQFSLWQLLLAHFGGLIWPTLGRCRLGKAFT